MKKLFSITLVLVLALSTFGFTAAADDAVCNAEHITMLDPVQGDAAILNSNVTLTYSDGATSAGYLTGANPVTAWQIAGAGTTLADTQASAAVANKGKFVNRVYGMSANEIQTLGDAKDIWRNNFVWEFDINVTKLEAGKKLCLLIGSSATAGTSKYYFNQIQLKANSAATGYQVRWAGVLDAAKDNASISSANVSNFELKFGNTYHLKLEGDLRGSGYLYATFTNNDSGTPYVQTSKSPLKLAPSMPAEGDITTANLPYKINYEGNVDITFSNQTFFMDRFYEKTPSLAVSDGKITASASAVNVTNNRHNNVAAPALILAAYDSNSRLAAYSINADAITDGVESLASYSYKAELSADDFTADGTYTVKAFVWNTLGKIQPYAGYAQKTVTVSNGALTE